MEYVLSFRVNAYGKGGLDALDAKGRAHAYWTLFGQHDRYVGATLDNEAHGAEGKFVLHYSSDVVTLRCTGKSAMEALAYYRRGADADVLLSVNEKTARLVGQDLRDPDAVIAKARASCIKAWIDAYGNDPMPLCATDHPRGGGTPEPKVEAPSASPQAITHLADATAAGTEH